MKKSIMFFLIIVLFILGIAIGSLLIRSIFQDENKKISYQNNVETNDETIKKIENPENNNELIEEASSQEEKISPNCSIVFKRNYRDCGHILEQYSNIPSKLINKTENDVYKEYPGWKIEEFLSNKIVLYRDFDSDCGEHYVLKEKEGKVVVYLKVGDSEEIVEETDIATEFLTEKDKTELKNGIEANGRIELNQLIEDFE